MMEHVVYMTSKKVISMKSTIEGLRWRGTRSCPQAPVEVNCVKKANVHIR